MISQLAPALFETSTVKVSRPGEFPTLLLNQNQKLSSGSVAVERSRTGETSEVTPLSTSASPRGAPRAALPVT